MGDEGSFAPLLMLLMQGTFICHPEGTDSVTVLHCNRYTWCRWLLHMLKPTKPTAMEFI